jgi:hypothetical protein
MRQTALSVIGFVLGALTIAVSASGQGFGPTGSQPTGGPDFPWMNRDVRDLLNKYATPRENVALRAIYDELYNLPIHELWFLKADDDPCADTKDINCRGLPSAKVKPVIEAVTSRRETADAKLPAYIADGIAGASLLISVISALAGICRRRSIPILPT